MGLTIMGNAELTSEQMAKYLLSKNASPSIDIAVEELTQLYLDIGRSEGVRGDIAFCQSLVETGCFRFGNIVTADMHNYAGLGATDNSKQGTGGRFPDAKTGILSQIQHLKAYGSTLPLNTTCVDGRFKLVTRGIALTWNDLSGRWASDKSYGTKIMAVYDAIKSIKVVAKPVETVEPKSSTVPAFIHNVMNC